MNGRFHGLQRGGRPTRQNQGHHAHGGRHRAFAAGHRFQRSIQQPVHSVVLLISPEDKPEEHLQAMEVIFKNLSRRRSAKCPPGRHRRGREAVADRRGQPAAARVNTLLLRPHRHLPLTTDDFRNPNAPAPKLKPRSTARAARPAYDDLCRPGRDVRERDPGPQGRHGSRRQIHHADDDARRNA